MFILSASLGCFQYKNLQNKQYCYEIFHILSRVGFENIEIPFVTLKRVLDSIEVAQSFNIRVASIHPLVYCLHKEEGLVRIIQVAKKYNIKNVITHPPIFDSKLIENPFEEWKNLIEKVRKKYPDVKILLENINPYSLSLFGSPTTYRMLDLSCIHKLNNIAKKLELGITFDTSHYAMSQYRRKKTPRIIMMSKKENSDTNLKFDLRIPFQKLKKKIKNIHLSNFYKGETHLPLTYGHLDLKSFLETLQKEKYNGCITLEIHPEINLEKTEHNLREAFNLLAEYLR